MLFGGIFQPQATVFTTLLGLRKVKKNENKSRTFYQAAGMNYSQGRQKRKKKIERKSKLVNSGFIISNEAISFDQNKNKNLNLLSFVYTKFVSPSLYGFHFLLIYSDFISCFYYLFFQNE